MFTLTKILSKEKLTFIERIISNLSSVIVTDGIIGSSIIISSSSSSVSSSLSGGGVGEETKIRGRFGAGSSSSEICEFENGDDGGEDE